MINIFDIGMNKGVVTQLFIEDMKKLGIEDYVIHGFEPNPVNFELCRSMFPPDRVVCHNLAVADYNGTIRLYSAPGTVGDSVFADKKNVDKNSHYDSGCVIFSEWFSKNIVPGGFNIVKTNMEGAEFYFYNDVIDSGLFREISIFCGMVNDPQKIPSLGPSLKDFYAKLRNNGIEVFRYTDPVSGKPNFDLYGKIKELYRDRK